MKICGGVAVSVECKEEENFVLTRSALEAAYSPKAKVLILPYPNNPTGATMDREQLRAVADFCIENDLIVITDEIYSELVYDRQYVSIASFTV